MVGRFIIPDMFDTNKYANNPKSDFLNWSANNAGTFDWSTCVARALFEPVGWPPHCCRDKRLLTRQRRANRGLMQRSKLFSNVRESPGESILAL